ncbi:MAG: hypothetical protein GX964_08515 [Syntrophomonadaceae bacterium]|nr:hypothetical protein [Syntrophomonadaceae bacterium]
MKQRQKDYLFVIGLVAVVAAIGFYTSYTTYRVKFEFPTQQTDLQESDFLVKSEVAEICVGREPLANVQKWFGEGQFLGMSTIYQPPGKEFQLWFTKKQNTVWIFQSSHPMFSTYRGIQVGDPLEKVIKAYGPNYARVSSGGSRADYDLQYGTASEGTATFRMHRDCVSKLVINRDPETLAQKQSEALN